MKRMKRLALIACTAGLAAVMLTSCGSSGTTAKASAPTTTAAPPKPALAIQADIVFGPKNLPDKDKAAKTCVLASRFPRNSQVVWRARVIDAANKTQLDATKVDVVVKLADGQSFPMKYGDHPKTNPTDSFWATSWNVPADYATGTVSYSITATTKDGATVDFLPFKVAPSLLTITDEVLPALPAK